MGSQGANTGRNKQGYVAWDAHELTRLFSPPPKRDDLTEVALVALFTGNREGWQVALIVCAELTR